MTLLPGALEELLTEWLGRQRWFPAKGLEFRLTDVGGFDLGTAPRIEHRLVGVDTGDHVQVIQVPLVFRSEPADDDRGLIGRLGQEWVYDGPRDPAFVTALLTLFGGSARGSASATGHQSHGSQHDPAAPARVLSAEQSNTSIIVDDPRQPLMVKLFRVITGGPNPDVEVTAALSAADVRAVPRVAGWIDGAWTAPNGESAAGHLAVSTEFVADGRDAWREAVAAVHSNTDFTAEAEDLGAATAHVHAAMADALGSVPATEAQADALVAQLHGRIEWALQQVRELRPHAERLDAHARQLSALTPAEVGALQRVHGDYHLGQVLHSPTRGWILLDFEGEPMRPLAMRIRPDVPTRDLVGMVRSFDYAAGFISVEQPDLVYQTRIWADRCAEAFLAGYHAVLPAAPTGPGNRLFEAMLIDKALYEVVYEARNRPDWITIPLGALIRVLER